MTEPLFTATSLWSLLGVGGLGAIAYLTSLILLPRPQTTQKDLLTYLWLVFDGLTHLSLEASYLYLSTFGRTVNGSSGVWAEAWKEYSKADKRWGGGVGGGDGGETVVSLEILTVIIGGPLALYIAYLISKRDAARHYWIVVLSTAEIYGGWMTFCPEWLTGSKYLNTDNWLHFWVYLVLMNSIWVVIPFYLLYGSYNEIASSLRTTSPTPKSISYNASTPKKPFPVATAGSPDPFKTPATSFIPGVGVSTTNGNGPTTGTTAASSNSNSSPIGAPKSAGGKGKKGTTKAEREKVRLTLSDDNFSTGETDDGMSSVGAEGGTTVEGGVGTRVKARRRKAKN